MRRSIMAALVTIAAFAASGGVATTVGAQAGGWQIPGASTEVAVYADGATYHMNIHHINLSPTAEEMAAAEPIYVVVFPINPLALTNLGPLSVQGYNPQCDPCFHPGLPLRLVYHDHVLSGTPNTGVGGGAQDWEAVRHPIAVMYSPDFINSVGFRPLTTVAQVQAGERYGDFLPINGDPSAANRYELPQNVVITIELVATA